MPDHERQLPAEFRYPDGVRHGAQGERDRMRALVIEARRFDSITVDGRRWIRADQVEAMIEAGGRRGD